jgi:hypothetical protein
MEREGVALGVVLSLNEPSREMEKEAASAGLDETGGMKVPRLQILTAAQVIDNRRPQSPVRPHRELEEGGPQERRPARAVPALISVFLPFI